MRFEVFIIVNVDYAVWGCDTVYYCRWLPVFWRDVLPLSSEYQ